jgi:hypothetical protein
MPAASLPWARRIGLDAVLVTCDDDNEASRRTIERNLGVPDEPIGEKLRYWISTAAWRPKSSGSPPGEFLSRASFSAAPSVGRVFLSPASFSVALSVGRVAQPIEQIAAPADTVAPTSTVRPETTPDL